MYSSCPERWMWPSIVALFCFLAALGFGSRADAVDEIPGVPKGILDRLDQGRGAAVYTPLGQTATFLGSEVTALDSTSRRVSVFLYFEDRSGLTHQAQFGIDNDLIDYMPLPHDPVEWKVGRIERVDWRLDMLQVPIALYDFSITSRDLPRLSWDAVSLLLPEDRGETEGWTFHHNSGSLPLGEALQSVHGVGLLGDAVGIACRAAPRPSDWVGVERRFEVEAGKRYKVNLEVQDTYPTVGSYIGKIEQRVYVDGKLVHSHDIGGDLSVGWYPVETLTTSDSSILSVRVEVRPLQPLGPYGWGKASRTWIRRVQVEPL